MQGTNSATISASQTLTKQSMTTAPAMLISDIKVSSGPWWASSLVSNRSLTMRDMMVPVLVESKYGKGQPLYMRKELRPHIRLDAHAQHMPPVPTT